MTHAERSDLMGPADLLARTGLGATPKLKPAAASAVAPAPARKVVVFTPRPVAEVEAELSRQIATGDPAGDAGVAHVRATILIAARDARATETALDAARRLIALHKMEAAADVLLDLIGAGFRDREAQRLLIEVNCELGRRDTAREKCQLLESRTGSMVRAPSQRMWSGSARSSSGSASRGGRSARLFAVEEGLCENVMTRPATNPPMCAQ